MIVLLLLALLLLGAVIAYVALGRDRVEVAWDSLPGPVKTILNVFVAGGLAVILRAVIDAQGVTTVDWPTVGIRALDAAFLGVAVAILRALNPIDAAYGLGKSKAGASDLGDH